METLNNSHDEVLQLIKQGKTQKQIAQIKQVSASAVSKYCKKMNMSTLRENEKQLMVQANDQKINISTQTDNEKQLMIQANNINYDHQYFLMFSQQQQQLDNIQTSINNLKLQISTQFEIQSNLQYSINKLNKNLTVIPLNKKKMQNYDYFTHYQKQ